MNANARLFSTRQTTLRILSPELSSLFEQIKNEGSGKALEKVDAMLRITSTKEINVLETELEHDEFKALSAELFDETESFEGPWSEQ